ncbi:MAG: class I SAM-dependent methyltransferase, partial [Clostridia bacterium]|nr:class I SAM-dependent methyltransferase [Clostridia bacterium]
MLIADGFKDFEVVDASGGEKAERWGKYTMVRPDPQVIWNTPKVADVWKDPDAVYSRSNTGGGKWVVNKLPESFVINYKELKFRIKPMNFKHTGLFPEQAVNWDRCAELIKNSGREIRVLNMFAYTGAASVAASKAGAQVCHVDASKGMTQWAKENAELNGISNIRFIVDDCVKFVEKEFRRGKKYDAIIMDPPSYGRGPGGEVWKLETEIYGLLQKTVSIMSDDPLFFLLNSYTTGLSAGCMGYML